MRAIWMNSDDRISLWLRVLVAVTLALVFGATLLYHRELISFPYPLDSSEPAEAFIARGVAANVDMRSLDQLPMYSEGYGPVYMYITGNLCRLGIACDLPSQRLLCAFFIAGVILIITLVCRKLAVPWLETLCAALWAYELLLVNVTPIARPGALGTLLWLAGLALPFLLDYSALSILGAALLITLAAFTKLYFLSGAGYLGAWIFFHKRERLPLFTGALLGFLALLCAVNLYLLPWQFYGNVLVGINDSAKSGNYMLWQLEAILLQHSPGLTLAALLLPFLPRWGRPGGGWEWALYGAFGTVLFVFLLGGATGGRFTYFIQLAALPFLPMAASIFSRLLRPRLLALGLLLACAAWAAKLTVHPYFGPEGNSAKAWRTADALLGMAKHPFVDSDMDCSLASRGLPVDSTGMCAWFQRATYAHGLAARLFPRTADMAKRYQSWLDAGRARVADPSTDMVMVAPDSPLHFTDLLDASYILVAKVPVPYPLTGGTSLLWVYIRPQLAPLLGLRLKPAAAHGNTTGQRPH